MSVRYFNLVMLVVLWVANGYAQSNKVEQHNLVAMRMIGHEVLLSSGDSSSRVLPVVKEADRYKIEFDSSFNFYPGVLAAKIDSVIKLSELAQHYIVEVESCEKKEVIYSYEHGSSTKPDIVPCQPRFQPKACYVIFISLLDQAATSLAEKPASESNLLSSSNIAWGIAFLLILFGLFRVFRKRKQGSGINPNLIPLGDYQFDRLNSELLLDDQRLELSAKESDLLYLLYQSANATLGRDEILHNVWGDEGDYVGRTLDVFISKLRKRLEFDTKIKIINIRGVGYKLVLNS